MNKKILVLLSLVAIVIHVSAAVQELPDVEIFGPSELKSILEKKSVLNSDLLLNDIVDSLRPILPDIPQQTSKTHPFNKYALYLDINTKFGFHSIFTADSVFSTPLSIRTDMEKNVIKEDWSNLALKLNTHYLFKRSKLTTSFATVNVYSPFDVDYQAVNAVKLHYSIDQVNAFNKMINLHMKAEIQNTRYENPISNSIKSNLYMNDNIGINFNANEDILVSLDAFYAYKTPLLTVNIGFNDSEDTDKFIFFNSISLAASDKKVVPGINLSKIAFINKNNYLQLFQESDIEIWDNYNLFLNQPWQQLQTDAILTFKPVNAHLIFNNKSFSINDRPVNIEADLGVRFNLDEPVYLMSGDNIYFKPLPFAEPENVLKNNISLAGSYQTDSFFLKQSVALERGWLTSNSNITLPYLPLVTLESNIDYKFKAVRIKSWLKQYYNTKTENKEYLRESLDLGAQVEYNINPDFTIFIKGQNLLNKGKYSYRTIPTEPTSAIIGLLYIF